MPQKPKKPCAKPGCPNLTTGRYCEEHWAEEKKERAESNRYYDQHRRDKRAEAFYKSRAWVAARRRVLIRDNYLCQECLRQGYIIRADTVHHKIGLKEDWSKRLQLDNLVSLCAKCHNQLHGGKCVD
jgi:5-methylcytosine-specific restriction protein A